MSLEHEIRRVINSESQENGSNTPDHILAAYVTACLDAFNQGVRRRDAWYGVSLSPGMGVVKDKGDVGVTAWRDQ